MVHNVRQTTVDAAVEESSYIEEMDWFMNYLKDGLYFAENLDDFPEVMLGSFADDVDNYYLYKQGLLSDRPRNLGSC